MNPYLLPVEHQHPLRLEMLHTIYAKALYYAVEKHLYPEAVPTSLPVEHLRQMRASLGPDVYTKDPRELAGIFEGGTHKLYQTIHRLYCTKEGRSIAMVWRILQKMAQQAQVIPLSYEALWAICLSLEPQRRARLDVSIERTNHIWWLGSCRPRVDYIGEKRGHALSSPASSSPYFVCLINVTQQRHLAFRLMADNHHEEVCQESLSTLYDALLTCRKRAKKAYQGIIWSLPHTLLVALEDPRLTERCRALCRCLGIKMEHTASVLPPLHEIERTWQQGLVGQTLSRYQCIFLFETALHRTFAGPEEGKLLQAEAQIVSNEPEEDPAHQFPLLRALLPEQQSVITETGDLLYHYRRYHHPLLSYWAGQPVTIRLSAWSEKTVWVYDQGDVLCQAQAP